jgi:DNA (cytosine-5)-methyltransferase 1
MSSKPHSSLKMVSLFTGAGGLDIGLERAGFKPISTCENERVACDTLALNAGWKHVDGREYFSGVDLSPKDIRETSAKDLNPNNDTVDCVVGGPPCQAFSSAGRGLSVFDQRGQLVFEYIRLIDELKPRSFLFENVRGVVTARDGNGSPGGVIRELYKRLEALGYSCRAALLNSADFGSHQRRVRCFIIGMQHRTAPDFPSATHSKGSTGGLFYERWRTLGEYLEHHKDRDPSNYVFPTERLAPLLRDIPNGSGLKSMGVAEPTRPGGHWGYRQGTFIADQTLPARTVTGSASQDWVRVDGLLRRLSFREVAGLQGFPEDWIFAGSQAQRFKQVGNAVPTLFGEIVGRSISDCLSQPHGTKEQIEFPEQFKNYIDYSERDHARNGSARKIGKTFAKMKKTSTSLTKVDSN